MKGKITRQFTSLLFLAFSIVAAMNAQQLKLEILNGHSGGGVLAVAVSHDGKFALTGSTDQTALLWDLETGKQLRRFAGYHEDAVSCVQFSKDGRFVLTASHDSSAQLWETATGRRVHGFGENRGGVLIKHSGKILSCAISADMKLVATAGEDKTARIWDFETGKQLFELRHAGRVNSITFSPDSHFLLTGGDDKIARLYSTETGKEEKQFVGHTEEITSVAYSPDGKQILTGSEDRTARVWDAQTGSEIRTFDSVFEPAGEDWAFDGPGDLSRFAIRKVDFAFNNQALILVPVGAHLWDLSSDKVLWTEESKRKWRITGVITSEEKRLLVADEGIGSVRVIDTSKLQQIYELSGFSNRVSNAAVSSNSHLVLSSTNNDIIVPDSANSAVLRSSTNNTSGLWKLDTGQMLTMSWIKENYGTIGSISNDSRKQTASQSATFSSDNKLLAFSDKLGVEIREMSAFKLIRHFDIAHIGSVNFSPDNKFILIGCEIPKCRYTNSGGENSRSGFISSSLLFNIETGELVQHFNQKESSYLAVFSPDGKIVATLSYSTIRLWNTATGEVKLVIKGFPNSRFIRAPFWSVAFSPDGTTISTASGGYVDMSKTGIGDAAKTNGVQFWDVETGKEIERFGGEFKISSNIFEGFKSVAYSPDGTFIAAGSFDGKVYLRNNETKELKKFEGHTDTVNSVKFAKDANGKPLVVSGSSDSTTRIWDAATGEEICALVTFRDGNWAVVQTKTGRYDAPNGGEIDGIQWVFGNEVIELKQLSAMYYTPNLLPRLLGYNKDELPKVVSLKDVKLYPEVVEQKYDAQTGKLNVKLRARNGGIGATEVYVKISIKDNLGNTTETEKLVVADARDERLKGNPNVPTGEIVSLSVELPQNSFVAGGENQIKVVTSNYLKEIGKGNIQSRGTETVHLDGGKKDLQMPTLYAIVGGVSDYAGDGLDLRFAAKDAEDFANALQLGAKRLFGAEKVHIQTLSTNREKPEEQPTKENFRRAVEEIARRAKPEDIFVLYLAGHGVTLGTGTDTYFYLAKEARSTAKTDLEANFQTVAVSNAEMMDWLTPDSTKANDVFIQARKQVIILDTCAAGNFAREEWKRDREGLTGDQIRAMEFLEKKTGTFVLMGSAANAVSYEANNYNQGLLTYSLLEGMKGFALQKPTENIDVRLLFDYAEKRVENLAKGLGLEQRPLTKQPSGNTFVIGQMSEAEKQKIELAKEKPLMLRPSLGMLPRNNDPLGLTAQLRKALDAESSYAVVRQRGEREPSLIYIDDDSLPNAVQVTETYTVEGEQVKVKAYLLKGDKEIAALEIGEPKAEVINKLLVLIRAELAELNKNKE